MLISVALCTYNGEKFIREQLDSILKQSLKTDEIIICDDGSTDNTISIIEEYIVSNPSIITLYENEVNLKVNKNFEKCISLCNGDYIFLSDQDDIWKPNKVEIILSIFKSNKQIEGVFSNAELIDEQSTVIPHFDLWKSVTFCEEKLKKPLDLFKIIKHRGNMVTGATLCLKASCLKDIIPIPDGIQNFYHDEWIAIILAYKKALVYTTENLISYRIHSNQQIGVTSGFNNKKIAKKERLLLNILNESSPKFYDDRKQLLKCYFNSFQKFKKLATKVPANFILNFEEISNENLNLHTQQEMEIKKRYFLQYLFRKLKHTFQTNTKK